MAHQTSQLALGTRKGLLIFDVSSGGARLAAVHHEGIPIAYAFRDRRSGKLWACHDHGHWGQKLWCSEDQGVSWREVATPAYPEGALTTSGEQATLKYLWCMQQGGADQPGRLYVGTEPGGLFRSDDDGESFELVRGLWDHETHNSKGWFGGGRDNPGIHSILVDPRDSRRVSIAVSCAGYYHSADDGATWSVRNKGLMADFLPDPTSEVGQDPHCVVRCESTPDVLWQQNHCGIYRSEDDGLSWQSVSQPGDFAHFGFAICADEQDPLSAWVVPAINAERRLANERRLVVAHTEDGGQTWREQTRGLPQAEAFDLVYRHAADQREGCLAIGSTTGNAYVSLDRGESWQTVSQNLPPIYSTRGI